MGRRPVVLPSWKDPPRGTNLQHRDQPLPTPPQLSHADLRHLPRYPRTPAAHYHFTVLLLPSCPSEPPSDRPSVRLVRGGWGHLPSRPLKCAIHSRCGDPLVSVCLCGVRAAVAQPNGRGGAAARLFSGPYGVSCSSNGAGAAPPSPRRPLRKREREVELDADSSGRAERSR